MRKSWNGHSAGCKTLPKRNVEITENELMKIAAKKTTSLFLCSLFLELDMIITSSYRGRHRDVHLEGVCDDAIV